MRFAERLKKDKAFRTKAILIAILIIFIWSKGGEEKKEFQSVDFCKAINNDDDCVSNDCVWDEWHIITDPSCASCIQVGDRITKADIYDLYPSKWPAGVCCSGAYLTIEDAAELVPGSQPGIICKAADDPDSVTEEETVCNSRERAFAKILWPKVIDSCKTAYYAVLFGGGFAALMMFMAVI